MTIEPLADQPRRFAEEYLIDFDVVKAAKRAGCAHNQAQRYLEDPRVQALIQEGKRKISDRVSVSVDYVVQKLRNIAEGSPVDYLEIDEFGTPVKVDLSDLTDQARDALKAVKFTKYGPVVETHDKISALVHLGKYLGVFADRVELTGANGGPIQTITSDMTPKEAMDAYAATLGK